MSNVHQVWLKLHQSSRGDVKIESRENGGRLQIIEKKRKSPTLKPCCLMFNTEVVTNKIVGILILCENKLFC